MSTVMHTPDPRGSQWTTLDAWIVHVTFSSTLACYVLRPARPYLQMFRAGRAMDAYPWIRTPQSPWISMDHMGRHNHASSRAGEWMRARGYAPPQSPWISTDHVVRHSHALSTAAEWMRLRGYAPPPVPMDLDGPHGAPQSCF